MAFVGSRPKMALRSAGLRRFAGVAMSVFPIGVGAEAAPGVGHEQEVGERLFGRLVFVLWRGFGQHCVEGLFAVLLEYFGGQVVDGLVESDLVE